MPLKTHLVTQKKLGEMFQASVAAVCRAASQGGPLHRARVGIRIDLNHPDARQWMEVQTNYMLTGERPKVVRGRAAAKKKKKITAPPSKVDLTFEEQQFEGLAALAEDMQVLAHRPLAELAEVFGTDERFCDWLKALKQMEDIQEKRLKNAASEGTLVARDLIKAGFIDPVERVFRQILTDGAKTISTKALAMAQAKRQRKDLEAWVKSQLTSYIRPGKNRMKKALRDIYSP